MSSPFSFGREVQVAILSSVPATIGSFALEINIPELVLTWLILLFPLKLSTTADLYKNRERDLGLTSAGLIMALEVQR